jgi:hypothetical protein
MYFTESAMFARLYGLAQRLLRAGASLSAGLREPTAEALPEQSVENVTFVEKVAVKARSHLTLLKRISKRDNRQVATRLIDHRVMGATCDRCGHVWLARILRQENGSLRNLDPLACPRCKTRYWNRAAGTQAQAYSSSTSTSATTTASFVLWTSIPAIYTA